LEEHVKTLQPASFSCLISLLSHEDVDVSLRALGALIHLELPVDCFEGAVVNLLISHQKGCRQQALEMLKSTRIPLTKLLMAKLHDKCVHVRRRVINAIGDLGDEASEHAAELAVLLEDSDQTVRELVAKALRKLDYCG